MMWGLFLFAGEKAQAFSPKNVEQDAQLNAPAYQPPFFLKSIEEQTLVWSRLTRDERRALAPLSSQWDQLPVIQRRRLLGVAKKYKTMRPEQQARIQARLVQWSRLSLAQRRFIRNNYQKLSELQPSQRLSIAMRWTEFQQQQKPQQSEVSIFRTSPAAVSPIEENNPSEQRNVYPQLNNQ